MGDQDDGQVVLDPHLLEQGEDLRLDGDVEGGGRLVAQEDLGAARQGDGDDHALAHPARELVGVLAGAPLGVGDAHVPQVFQGLVPRGPAPEGLVQLDGLHDLVPHRLEGVEAGHGVLHDHGDLPPAHLEPVLFPAQVGQAQRRRTPVVVDGAVGDGAVCVQQAHERLGKDRLARAALPHDGQHLAGVDVEVDAPYGAQDPPPQVEADVYVAGRKDRRCIFHPEGLLTAYGSWGRPRPRRRCRSGKRRW